ncbi:MAG TPA: hypothetical protein VGL40_08500 [Bacillota bacterium]|jgi:hypothetical protein
MSGKVAAVEDVSVPAGTFRCYKFEMPIGPAKQYVWYGVDGPHPLVKYDNGDLALEPSSTVAR